MNHEGQLYCVSMQYDSFVLRVMTGCHYNGCRFCGMFKKVPHGVMPLPEVEEELARVVKAGGNPRKVFLMDGDALYLPTDYLLKILNLIHQYFPACEEVNTEATVSDVLEKSVQELRLLKAAGLCHVYVGIETVLDDVLAFMNKDHTAVQGREAAARLLEAGLYFDAHVITGIAGAGRGEENALTLVEFFKEMIPHDISNFTLGIFESSPLYKDVMEGRFSPASEQENLKEMRLLISSLNTCADEGLRYFGINEYTHARVKGLLPHDREAMLKKLDLYISRADQREPMYACSLKDGKKRPRYLTGEEYNEFIRMSL